MSPPLLLYLESLSRSQDTVNVVNTKVSVVLAHIVTGIEVVETVSVNEQVARRRGVPNIDAVGSRTIRGSEPVAQNPSEGAARAIGNIINPLGSGRDNKVTALNGAAITAISGDGRGHESLEITILNDRAGRVGANPTNRDSGQGGVVPAEIAVMDVISPSMETLRVRGDLDGRTGTLMMDGEPGDLDHVGRNRKECGRGVRMNGRRTPLVLGCHISQDFQSALGNLNRDVCLQHGRQRSGARGKDLDNIPIARGMMNRISQRLKTLLDRLTVISVQAIVPNIIRIANRVVLRGLDLLFETNLSVNLNITTNIHPF